MLITKLAIRKHSRTIGEIHWPEIGAIGVNGVDRVLGTILRSSSERLHNQLASTPLAAVNDMEHVEAMADYMFPGVAPWLWIVHDSLEDVFLRENN